MGHLGDRVHDLVVEGPAVIEERESTIVVLPGFYATIDASRNVHVRRGASAGGVVADLTAEASR